MTSFEKTVKRRMMWALSAAMIFGITIVAALILKITGILGVAGVLSTETLTGFLVGVAVVSAYRINKYRKALKDRNALEELHIKETDERSRVIALKSCKATICAAFALLGIAGIVMSFIDPTVFLTIGIILIVLLVLCGVFALFYSRKY
jgi:hypothetical protein